MGITEWLAGWKARGWKTASKAPVKNVELWQALDAATTQHQIQWRWERVTQATQEMNALISWLIVVWKRQCSFDHRRTNFLPDYQGTDIVEPWPCTVVRPNSSV